MSKLNPHPTSPSRPIAPHIGLCRPVTPIFANADFNQLTSRYVQPISEHLRTQMYEFNQCRLVSVLSSFYMPAHSEET